MHDLLCMTCTTLDFISASLHNGIPVDVILLDFAKAFDNVPHRRLLTKLRAYGFDGLILKWIEAFLKDRRQRVVQGEIVSDWVEILEISIFHRWQATSSFRNRKRPWEQTFSIQI